MSRRPVILLVDDRAEDLAALRAVLQATDATLLEASSGKEALRLLLEHDVALILMDVEMPGMTGLETAEIIRGRERTRHVPIVFVTAHDQDGGRVRHAYRLNAVDVVAKPLVAEIVRAKVQVFVDLFVLRDREREASALLEERAAQAERSNADLSLFAHVAAHDMQEPLSTVARYLKLLDRRASGRLEPEAKEWLAQATEEIHRLRALIKDLLDYAKIPTGTERLVRTSLDVPLDRALQALKERIEAQHATVSRQPLPSVPCDAGQMVRLFQNLVSNALKFRSEAPPHVEIAAEREGASWRVSVADNGVGIPNEARERIFALFERLHPRTSHPGTGLGLSICRRIVEGHGGRIWAEPREGGGSVFHFTIPAGAPAAGTGDDDKPRS